jgi:outer membrane receptor for ferrienterochelin and colicin
LSEVRVTSVSKVPEKITEAPASITVIPAVQIQERPALSILEHLKNAPGVSFSEGGLVQSNIVSRGFNNIFSGSLLTLIDNRLAAVPSLRVNVPAFFSTTNDDIEQMEFVLGPGAALPWHHGVGRRWIPRQLAFGGQYQRVRRRWRDLPGRIQARHSAFAQGRIQGLG